jgi:hypothetical protein
LVVFLSNPSGFCLGIRLPIFGGLTALLGTMAATHENDVLPVPRKTDRLVTHFDNVHPTLKGQLGDKARTRKQKTKSGPDDSVSATMVIPLLYFVHF